ncbi:hypothetical protein GMW39_00875 [Pectobacterium parmentieri]|uniref:hypothetical protein n=1 Tax=Pectobacterium parmentieri TaxID=1905730 RepID=UPI001373C280|nr:hypothetical protein [Pectobacterium parmentieri]QHQ14562.1 hypothetical protein GMW39_00875 [Pectobacterium parmentieri]
MSKKFLEIVGNASTSATFNGKLIGHNVNASAYEKDGEIIIHLETNGSRWKSSPEVRMTKEEYDSFCEKQSRPLFVRGIELFGAEVLLS